jgi:acyl carrier protein
VTTSKEVYDRLSAVLQDDFEDDSLVAEPDLTADAVAGWDSLANLRLMLTVQKAFGVKFTAHEITSLNNVGELASLVEAKTVLHQ